jgi:hypothetical protein
LSEPRVQPWTRVAIMLAALASALALSRLLTGSYVPESPADALIFQNALLLVVLGSAISEHKYTKPGDSVVNGLMGLVTLVTVYDVADPLGWWIVAGYCVAVFATASVCTIASTGPDVSGWRQSVASFTYRPAVVFGKARV